MRLALMNETIRLLLILSVTIIANAIGASSGIVEIIRFEQSLAQFKRTKAVDRKPLSSELKKAATKALQTLKNVAELIIEYRAKHVAKNDGAKENLKQRIFNYDNNLLEAVNNPDNFDDEGSQLLKALSNAFDDHWNAAITKRQRLIASGTTVDY